MLCWKLLGRVVLTTALITVPVRAQWGNLEPILLPIAFRPGVEVRGAYGTIWRGEVWVHNSRSQRVDLQLILGCMTEDCYAPYAGGYMGILTEPLGPTAEDRGILLTPTASDAPYVSFSNRIFEVTRHAQPQGIEVPVVRGENFFSGPLSLLGIPNGPAVRSMLRVYDPQRIAGTTFTIELLDPAGDVIGTTQLRTTFGFGGGSDPIRPGFASIADLTSAFGVPANVDHVHVRINPDTPGTKFWAMVSVTDNDTQQVLLITPQ